MASDPSPDWLPDDWRPHVDVERDGMTLKVRGEHFPNIAFLFETNDFRSAVSVTPLAREGLAFAEAEKDARKLQAAWLKHVKGDLLI